MDRSRSAVVVTMRRRRVPPRTFGMLLTSYLWILFGVGTGLGVPQYRPGVFHLLIPHYVMALLWLGPAAAAVALAWKRPRMASVHGRPMMIDLSSLAVAGLSIAPVLCTVSFASGFVLWLVPGGSIGYRDGWFAALYFLSQIALCLLCAVIPSPTLATRGKGKPDG